MSRSLPGLNGAVTGIAPPPIPEARAWADRYDGSAGPVIDLTQAVPGYPPPPELVARLAEAARETESYAYGHITGDLALREAYAADVSTVYGGEIGPEDVAITTGANMASFAVTLALAGAGDAVMLPSPWYFNHQMNAAMLGVEVVPLPCDAAGGFLPDPDRAERALTDRVRAILLVSPNNPTGAVYSPSVIEAFANLCRRRGLWLVLDETYRDFRPAELARPHDLFRSDEWRSHVIQLYSFSKSYCVPGFRAGAVVADRSMIGELTKVLDCLQICAPRVGQAALSWAIPALAAWRDGNRALMIGRGAACQVAFAAVPGWRLDSHGSYFAYLRHPFPGASSWAVAEALATRRGILTLPGEAFGPDQQNHLRLAFANVEEAAIGEAVRRLAELDL